MKNDLLDAVTAIHLSRAVIRNVKENLFWAFYIIQSVFRLRQAFSSHFGDGSGSDVCRSSDEPEFGLRGIQRAAPALFKPHRSRQADPQPVLEKVQTNDPITEKGEKSMKKTLKIDGMMCSHCTGRVSQVLNAIDGVSAEVSLEDKAAYLTLSADVADDVLIKAVTDAGYTVTEVL